MKEIFGDAGEPMLLTPFCELETLNAFSLGLFRNHLSEKEVYRLRHDFQLDLEVHVYQLRPLPITAFTRTKSLAEKITPTIGFRMADLLHIAAAIELGAKSLYTFDQKQHQSAQSAGLKVNNYPHPNGYHCGNANAT